jgi:hypothetical protein
VAQLAHPGARQKKQKELALSEDRFHIAPEEIQNEQVSEQVPWTCVQKRGRKKLPSIGRVDPKIA